MGSFMKKESNKIGFYLVFFFLVFINLIEVFFYILKKYRAALRQSLLNSLIRQGIKNQKKCNN